MVELGDLKYGCRLCQPRPDRRSTSKLSLPNSSNHCPTPPPTPAAAPRCIPIPSTPSPTKSQKFPERQQQCQRRPHYARCAHGKRSWASRCGLNIVRASFASHLQIHIPASHVAPSTNDNIYAAFMLPTCNVHIVWHTNRVRSTAEQIHIQPNVRQLQAKHT